MAGRSLGLNELISGRSTKQKIVGRTNLDGLIQVSLAKFPEAQIRSKIDLAINNANRAIAIDLKRALDDALRSTVWNGEDIYESGNLLSSGSVTVNDNGITVAYDAPYAAIVHYGGYIYPYGNVNAQIYLPPRPWVESVMFGGGPVPRFNFESYYLSEFKKQFG